MTENTSIGNKIKRLSGLADPKMKDLNNWELEFVVNILEKTQDGKNTTNLTEKQVDHIDRLFSKHFAG